TELLDGLGSRRPDVGLVALAEHPDDILVRRAAYLGFRMADLHDGVDTTAAAIMSTVDRAAMPAVDTETAQLTCRQWQVLELVAAGYRSREIAVRLGISAKTVDR